MTREEGPGRFALLLGEETNRLVWLEDGRMGLKRVYTLLGCQRVDVVRLADGIDMWVDDEGAFTGAQVNRDAVLLARAYGHTHQLYVGPALVCGVSEEGDSVGLTNLQVYEATAKIPHAGFDAERLVIPVADDEGAGERGGR